LVDLTHSDEDRPYEVADGDDDGEQGAERRPPVGRRIEVICGEDRRRRWPPEIKAKIIAESLIPGVNVSRLARLHGLNVGLLHQWRRAAREKADAGPVHFIPVLPANATGVPAQHQGAGCMEIEVRGVIVRLKGAVDVGALRSVLAALRAPG
jgi:transposase